MFPITELASCLHGTDHLHCSRLHRIQNFTTFSVVQLNVHDRWLRKLFRPVHFGVLAWSTGRPTQFCFDSPNLGSPTFFAIYSKKQMEVVLLLDKFHIMWINKFVLQNIYMFVIFLISEWSYLPFPNYNFGCTWTVTVSSWLFTDTFTESFSLAKSFVPFKRATLRVIFVPSMPDKHSIPAATEDKIDPLS